MVCTCLTTGIASAAEMSVRETVQTRIDQAMTVIRDPAFQTESSLPVLRAKLVETLEPLFTFREMTVRALGANARSLKPGQIDTLTPLFRKLLERVYIDRLTANLVSSENRYTVENIEITGVEERGNFAKVLSKASIVQDGDRTDLAMNYRLVRRDSSWVVYDVEIEGVSLIENYRAQFTDILTSKSFDDLVHAVEQNIFALEKKGPDRPIDRDKKSAKKTRGEVKK